MSRLLKVLFGVMVVAGAASPASAQTCDRACLRTMLDQYLAAVIKHDPAAAPLVVGFRQTENAINVRPGNGVWKTVTGLGKVQRRYFDPVTGQAAYFGTVEEGSETPIVSVRLRVENRKLTEAEWFLARANDPGLGGPRRQGGPPANLHNPDYLAANPPRDTAVPRNQRSDRDTLIRIVDSYFDAITSHDGSVALTHQGCGRVENGSPAPAGAFLPAAPRGQGPGGGGAAPAGRAAAAGQGPAQPGPAGNDCVGGLQNFNASMVVARRTPLVDEEAQVVLAYAVFIRRPGSPTPRNAFSEWFVIDAAKIKTVYAAMFYPAPELAVPNWPPYIGNWPLPATTVPAPAPPK
ncbi:MAG TPA: hypothetical protein VM846_20400 [Vicinamibacterales bacterium]|nr:hypothetical protein [Vicinamibacterales bacterium]